MKQKTKRFLVTTLFASTLACSVIGWATNLNEPKITRAENATTAISLVDGAACRIRTANDTEQGSGIRFKAVLDRTQWEALAGSNEMTAGIMIMPTDYITAAGGYTHSALDTADKNYLDFTYTEEEVGEKTVLAASMINILDQNYSRDFSGVAYLKSTTVFEGATEYNGAYYAYASYTEGNNSRSIYEIARLAYNDRVSSKVTPKYEYSVTYNEMTSYSPYNDEQREVLKGYLDGVVDIKKNAYAEIFVTNNTEYYTSPYTIEKRSNAEFVVNYDKSVTAKSMLYNGNRIKGMAVKDGKTSVSLTDRIVFSENTVKIHDGTVTMPARQTGGGAAISTIASMDADYIAWEGDYGIGTYVDFTFTGNNMPQVMFFADQINSNITNTGGTGIICMNGLTGHESSKVFIRCTDYLVFGPNRINTTASAKNYDHGQQIATILSTGTTANPGDYPLLSQTGLRGTADTNYAYTVGTIAGTDGYLYMDIYLSYAETGELIYHIEKKTNLKIVNMPLTSGNIVAYTCWKGSVDTETTTFSYSEPYTIEELTIPNSGATINPDGSVTLTGIRPLHAGYGSGVGNTGKESSYIAFEGEYGAGTYIDVEFTGNNMPYVMFFANGIDGYIGTSSVRTKGLILTNGFVTAGNTMTSQVDTPIKTDRMMIWGPNGYKGDANGAGSSLKEITDCAALTQDGLNSDTYKSMKLRYTVGTYTDGTYVGIHISLYNRDTNQRLYDNAFLTTVKVSDVTAGNIILFAPAKGLNKNATFSYSDPYQSKPSYSGATFNSDGTVTLAPGKEGTREGSFASNGYNSGMGGYVNNYISFAGEYGVGTVTEYTFKGNNMPQVMLFANEINSSMTWGDKNGDKGYTGYLILNGYNAMHTNGGGYTFGKDFLYCYGPQKISKVSQPGGATKTNFTYETGYEYTTLEEMLDADTTYKYVVWSEVNSTGKVDIRVQLFNLANDTLLVDGTYATGKTEAEVEALGGNIVAYAGVKGTTTTTTFAYSEPYMNEQADEEETVDEGVLFSGATLNEDGSVTLAGGEAYSAGWKSGISEKLDNSYIAYDDEYILGTEVAFTFKGNNLPQVMLFADAINGDMSKLGGTGILLMNGLYVANKPIEADSNYLGENELVCFAPNRLYDNYYTLIKQTSACAISFESGYEWVVLDENTSYKYVVWTEEIDSKIVVCVELYNAVTSELLSKGDYATDVGVNDIAAGAIVAYAAVKGNGNDTTFFCHEPKMHEDTMSFYTYGAPGTYTTETDLTTEAVLADYVASGMNTMILGGKNAYNGKSWKTSTTKAVMDTARNAGIKKFIISDSRLYTALYIEGSLIGDGCKFDSEAELDAYVKDCILDYVNEDGFYGVILRDEPTYTYATSIGQVYRSIKRVAETLYTEIYVQLNLLPMASNAQASYKATTTDSLYNDYVDYVDLFLTETGADIICVDKYPFVNDGYFDEFLNDYYSCYKALAEVCLAHDAEFGFVLQSWTHSTAQTLTQAEMNLQMNAALAFGAKEIAFYTYVPSDDGENTSSSFVDSKGIKTEVYNYAQNAIDDAKSLEKLLADYDYVGAQMTNNARDTEFVNDTFEKMTYTSEDTNFSLSLYKNWTVATEAYNDATDTYLYTVINANAYNQKDVQVTMTFAGYTQAYVVVDGVAELVSLANGVYTATLALGEAIYIIPIA